MPTCYYEWNWNCILYWMTNLLQLHDWFNISSSIKSIFQRYWWCTNGRIVLACLARMIFFCDLYSYENFEVLATGYCYVLLLWESFWKSFSVCASMLLSWTSMIVFRFLFNFKSILIFHCYIHHLILWKQKPNTALHSWFNRPEAFIAHFLCEGTAHCKAIFLVWGLEFSKWEIGNHCEG